MLFYVVLVCKCVLPPGDNPIAVNKYYYYYYYYKSVVSGKINFAFTPTKIDNQLSDHILSRIVGVMKVV